MPIRFRCQYCNQLMGIAHRKVGTEVECPTCKGKLIVPPSSAEHVPIPAPAAQPPFFARNDFNFLKPLHIDDAAYFYYARQIADHPLDPYGFRLLWYQEPNAATDILAPPVLPYTWALGLRLFGDEPAACKLLLLPWCFLLVFA